jgi:hypothetical protein
MKCVMVLNCDNGMRFLGKRPAEGTLSSTVSNPIHGV